MQEQKKQFFNFISQIIHLDDQIFQDIWTHCSFHHYKKKEFLLRNSETPKNLYFITKGIARTVIIDEEGNEFTKGFKAQGELISAFVDSLTKSSSRVSLQAVNELEVISISLDDVEKLADRHPILHKLIRKIIEFHYIQKEQREDELLTLDAKARYLSFLEKNQEISQKIPQYMIASFLKMTPVFLSRISR